MYEISDEYPGWSLKVKVAGAFWGQNANSFEFDKDHWPPSDRLPCSNPRCRNGGLSVSSLRDKVGNQGHSPISGSMMCPGDLDARQKCFYKFEYEICCRE